MKLGIVRRLAAAGGSDPHPTTFRITRQRLWRMEQSCQVTYEVDVALKHLSALRAACLTYRVVRDGELFAPITSAMCSMEHYTMVPGPVRYEAFLDIARRATRLAGALALATFPEIPCLKGDGTLPEIVPVPQEFGFPAHRDYVADADVLARFGF